MQKGFRQIVENSVKDQFKSLAPLFFSHPFEVAKFDDSNGESKSWEFRSLFSFLWYHLCTRPSSISFLLSYFYAVFDGEYKKEDRKIEVQQLEKLQFSFHNGIYSLNILKSFEIWRGSFGISKNSRTKPNGVLLCRRAKWNC